ncbi:MAG TPA: hypothetical protein VIV15_01290, partial [Anaerolineales bacterium]
REIYIESTDFSESPPAGWMRLKPGGEVRLLSAYLLRCDEVVKDPATGAVAGLRCAYNPDSLGKSGGAKRGKSTAIQWVSAAHALPAEVRLYNRLCTTANPEEPEEGKTFKDYLNPESVQVLAGCFLEPWMAESQAGDRFQFVRHGYFISDSVESKPGALVFNRIVELRDTYKAGKSIDASRDIAKGEKPARRPEERKDIPPIAAGTVSDDRVRARSLDPSLSRRYDRYLKPLGLTPELADVLTGDPAVADFFDTAVAAHPNARAVANWMANDVMRELKGRPIDELPFTAGELAELVGLVDSQAITSAAAKTVFEEMSIRGGKPREIAARLGLDQAVSPSELASAIDAVLAGMPDKVETYRAGKTSLLGLFTGRVMKATGGKASPHTVQELLKKKLGP